MFRHVLLIVLIAGLAWAAPVPFHLKSSSSDWPRFRGPTGDNISLDKGLLRTWPKDGPKLLWKSDAIGFGFSSVTLAGNRLFTLGDRDGDCYVYALDRTTGKTLWTVKAGKAGTGQYAGSRSTPTVHAGMVYVLAEKGDLLCLEAHTGREKWRRNLITDFAGEPGGFGYAESPLIDGEHLLCTPGGAKSTMVALNRTTGNPVWSCPANCSAGYASIVISKAAGVKQYVQLTNVGAIGVSAKDGTLLWKYDKVAGTSSNATTPVVLGDSVFIATGLNKGCALLTLSAALGGKIDVKEVYYKPDLKNRYGGVTAVGDHLFADHDAEGIPFCADWKTGMVAWKRSPAVGTGKSAATMTYADSHLYVLYENGVVALVPASAKGYSESGAFKVPNATSELSRAVPVVVGGRLYLRVQDTVWCYHVAAR